MLKGIAVIMVMSAAFLLGCLKRGELLKREERLSLIKWETVRLKSRVESCSAALLDAFEESGFFAPAAESIKNGADVYSAVLPLGEDVEGFGLFARGLGAATSEEQTGNMEVFLSSLEREISAARERTQKLGRLYVGGSLAVGAAVCIMLI